ncbi:Fe2OG dioxygenase domain-containing protein [Mycena indigotica]|uniref:Fe2OG dioxygenase domain-containing protein n=1 Tax=Mycena indigotica TaxID=2126181 RepID=A0A8H6S090_9AGAR|nr:Fe2OG dioxygenase domain-containing protein [Mycena indigotica]KAF7288895.1 Fe2OG dioxygenase domain-containing protein [Mycena indigotica]
MVTRPHCWTHTYIKPVDTLQHLEQALTRPVLHTSGLVAVKGPDLELAHKNTRGWHAMNFLHHSYVDLGYLAEHSLDDPPHRTLDRSHFSHGLDLAVLQDIVADITPNMLQAEPHAVVRAVLDRLDVYVPGTPPIHWGPSDIVDAHIGTLVIVFPTHHSGGALTFTRGTEAETVSPAGGLVTGGAMAHIAYAAYRNDTAMTQDHIDSGHRVTMSYKLFAVQRGERAMCGPGLSSAEDDMALAMRRLAAALFPPNSDGMLCFGLAHAYPIPCTPTDERSLRDVVPLLRGVDKRIATAARAAGMEVVVRLVYEVEPEELLANDDDCATELYHVAVDRVIAMSDVDDNFEPVDGQRAAWKIFSAGEILCPVSVTPPTLKRSRSESRQPSRSDDFSKVLNGKRATCVDAHWVTPLTQINCAKSSFLYADNERPEIEDREAYAALFVHIPRAESEEKGILSTRLV